MDRHPPETADRKGKIALLDARGERRYDVATVGQDSHVALTKAEQRKAADLIQQVLDLVDHGHLAVDGPAGIGLVRRLEGAMLALRAMAGSDLGSQIKPI